MLRLENVSVKEFKKTIYGEYKKLFPIIERKPYGYIKKQYELKITEILKIVECDKFIGFMIITTMDSSKYVYLEYFAILPQYQGNGYGTKAIKLLKEKYKDYNGIFVEIEKVENDKDITKSRRAKFYELLGFYKLSFDIVLYTVLYTPYVLQISNKKEDDMRIIEEIFSIYIAISGQKKVSRNCKVIPNIQEFK